MAIDLLNILRDTRADYRGAVITTYTLNLNFFEQIIAPKLTALGCTNTLILTDLHGYDEALSHGIGNLTGVGKRYVCAPLANPGRGVQHAKILLLVGPRQGCLLIGSGNLTLPGYGRNLEQFTRFEISLPEEDNPSPAELYPFLATWQLLRELEQRGLLSGAATERLSVIAEVAPWLKQPVPTPDNLKVFHSLDRSLLSQLPPRSPLDELQLIAPFFDLTTIEALVERWQPRRLVVGLDAFKPNLNGAALAERCRAWGCELSLRTLDGRHKDSEVVRRLLHAKTIIGSGPGGTWYLSGSANITRPGWQRSWAQGGNLELVVRHRLDGTDFLKEIWNDDQLTVQSVEPEAVQALAPDEPDPQPGPLLRLVELSYRSSQLIGKFVYNNPEQPIAPEAERQWRLELLHQAQQLPVNPDPDGRFTFLLDHDLKTSEAARLITWTDESSLHYSPYHWIDQLDELARYGHRAYHARVKEQLQTFSGAGRLFEDLLNFLWQRVDPQAIQQAHETDQKEQRLVKKRRRRGRDDDDTLPVPPAEDFITDEGLVETITWQVDGYLPHDQSTMSLRDLLSLALLRLTSETRPAPAEAGDAADQNEDADADRTEAHNRQRVEMLVYLRGYLLRYCRKYARRLLEPETVARVGPELILENHATLGRVLLEFADKADEHFSQQDLRQTVLLILGGFFWPEAAELDGSPAWQSFIDAGHDVAALRKIWTTRQLSSLSTALIAEAWEKPPRWTTGLHNEPLVQQYLLGQALLQRMEQCIGEQYWCTKANDQFDMHDLWGYRHLPGFDEDEPQPDFFNEFSQQVNRLASYKTPVEEKYTHLFEWWNVQQGRLKPSSEVSNLAGQIQAEGYAREMKLLKPLVKKGQLRAIEGDSKVCPGCFMHLPDRLGRRLRAGHLEVCQDCRHPRTALYWKPVLAI